MKPVGILLGALVLAGCAGTREPTPKPAAAACGKSSFTIYFDTNETTLTEPARAVVADAAKRLQGCAINSVRVVGLADAGGSPAQNLELSAARAAHVVEAFAAYGWPKPSFEIAAAGAAGATTPSGEAKPLRRRVEVFVDAGPK
ncbi:OmpA family protein [Caulobacter sp. 17J80-11]|uniref:OmpA family protein n=1 Tax=Caulobacter sp. 17J80-11 TaxID=2763502 RepID=UPI0016539A23|nr:OmpA family protein [Caulobacter sp. 17J80-11]MBC6983199.1 OmpA family protein [Caulobacter sp. 17J80-11]